MGRASAKAHEENDRRHGRHDGCGDECPSASSSRGPSRFLSGGRLTATPDRRNGGDTQQDEIAEGQGKSDQRADGDQTLDDTPALVHQGVREYDHPDRTQPRSHLTTRDDPTPGEGKPGGGDAPTTGPTAAVRPSRPSTQG